MLGTLGDDTVIGPGNITLGGGAILGQGDGTLCSGTIVRAILGIDFSSIFCRVLMA